MEFFSKQIDNEQSPDIRFADNGRADSSRERAATDAQDTITSLMDMADNMEDLLPTECVLSMNMDSDPIPSFQNKPTPGATAEGDNLDFGSTPCRATCADYTNRFADCLSSVTGATASLRTEALTNEADTDVKKVALDLQTVKNPAELSVKFNHVGNSHSLPSTPIYPRNVTDMSGSSIPAPELGRTRSSTGNGASVPSGLFQVPGCFEHHSNLSSDPLLLAGNAFDSCSSPGQTASGGRPLRELFDSSTSPVSVRDIRDHLDVHSLDMGQGGVGKSRKTGRKPKTYSKPVASRFCHICSRMPRRGQGSATCRRMAEGFCRKIVCEQCLREQGWNYEDIRTNPGSWLCPHCAEVCPARSQCHIYNRINARRKKAGVNMGKVGQTASVAAALASTDALMGPYGHLFNSTQSPAPQILQPPPNFRLNLPPQYSQP